MTLKVFVPGFGASIAPEHNLTFDGDLTLKFAVNRSAKRIELNALKLNFDKRKLEQYEVKRIGRDGGGEKGPKVTDIRVDEALEKVERISKSGRYQKYNFIINSQIFRYFSISTMSLRKALTTLFG